MFKKALISTALLTFGFTLAANTANTDNTDTSDTTNTTTANTTSYNFIYKDNQYITEQDFELKSWQGILFNIKNDIASQVKDIKLNTVNEKYFICTNDTNLQSSTTFADLFKTVTQKDQDFEKTCWSVILLYMNDNDKPINYKKDDPVLVVDSDTTFSDSPLTDLAVYENTDDGLKKIADINIKQEQKEQPKQEQPQEKQEQKETKQENKAVVNTKKTGLATNVIVLFMTLIILLSIAGYIINKE